MKPYQGSFRATVSLLVLLLCWGAATPAATDAIPVSGKFPPITTKLATDAVTRKGFEQFYNMEYDQAIATFEKVLAAHPDDPFAVNHLLSAVMFKEMYRMGALDSELYADNSFVDSKQLPPDPKVRERIQQLMDRANALTEARLAANSDDVDALYARGVTRGTKAMYMGMVDKSWFSALRSAIGARHDHERVLQLQPDYIDAKLIVGVHNYVVGSIPWPVKIAASVIGLSGSRTKGVELLYDAARNGSETKVDAKIALSLFLRREQRYTEAIDLINSLVVTYPRNFLTAVEYANLLNAAGRGPEAIAAYRRLLENGHTKIYQDPRLEQAAYGLGEALCGQRDFQGAAIAYEKVSTYPKVDPGLSARANLAAGEMYDLLANRETALKKYQAVIAADANSEQASLARKYIKQRYKLPKS